MRTPSRPHDTERLERFDVVERLLHWSTATLFVILMLTAVPLYFGSVEALVGRRELLAEVHTWAGVALPVPLLLSVAGPWGAQLRRDLRRINLWSRSEARWLRTLGRDGQAGLGKFNPGQKLNAAFVGGAIVVMLATGSVMKWFTPFPVAWRTGATFVHDVLATVILVAVIGHIGFAVTHRDSLRAMVRGWVTRAWAVRNAPGWLDRDD